MRYMQEWEEREFERREAKAEGKADEISIIRKKLEKGICAEEIAEWMELDVSYLNKIDVLLKKYPDESDVQIAGRVLGLC